MKRQTSLRFLLLLIAALGAAGLGLLLALYSLEASTGLLPANHPFHIGAILLTVLTAGLTAFFVLPIQKAADIRLDVPVSRLAACGAFFAGLWLLPAAFTMLRQADTGLRLVRTLLGFASAVSLIASGWFHFKNKATHFLLHATVCLFFALHMLCQYQIWSGMPQIADYLLPLLGCIFLTLTAYHRTAFDIGMGSRRALLFCGLMAGFCSICSVSGESGRLFYLAGGLWSLTNLWPQRSQEETDHVSA